MSLKILHTSDWHLGKKLFKKDRVFEHEQFLDWLIQTIKIHDIDALLIAGDIFDSVNPPNSALKMYYDFLANVAQLGVGTYIISGNHDSSGLIKSAQAILEDKDIKLSTHLEYNITEHCEKIWSKDKSFYIRLKSLPYFRNYEILNWISSQQSLINIDHDERVNLISNTLKHFFDSWPDDYNDKYPSILMAHHLFGNFIEAGSEQALSLSGLDSIPVELIKNFDYVALGHIHKTQYISKAPVVLYPGSPIPMRFSESNKKAISLLKCSSEKIEHELIDIPNFITLIQLKTNLKDIFKDLEKLILNTSKTSYLELILEMDKPSSGITDLVREKLLNSNIELLSFCPQFSQDKDNKATLRESQSFNIEDLFKLYYQEKFHSSEVDNELLEEFHNLLEIVRNEDSQS